MTDAMRVPVLHLDGFDGPLDLLLDLAERHRIDLGRVSAAALAEQFVAATERLAAVPMERRAAWLVMAARLVLLRSLLLRPVGQAEDAAQVVGLVALPVLRAASAWLEARPVLGVDTFPRAEPAGRPGGGYVALMEACLTVLRGRTRAGDSELAYRPSPVELWRVPDALARIRAMLADHPEGGGLALFVPGVARDEEHRAVKVRAAVASTFVAGLELARASGAEMSQGETFGPIGLRAAG